MTLCEAEQPDDLFGGRPLCMTVFGVKRERFDVLALQGLSQFTLDQGLSLKETARTQGDDVSESGEFVTGRRRHPLKPPGMDRRER